MHELDKLVAVVQGMQQQVCMPVGAQTRVYHRAHEIVIRVIDVTPRGRIKSAAVYWCQPPNPDRV